MPACLAWLALAAAAVLVESRSSAQPAFHFRPADGVLGDVHPYFERGICHLFYLREGFHSALARSSDLWQWQETPVHYAGQRRDDHFRPYFVLGVLRDEPAGLYRSFYGCKGRMVGSTSADLRTWQAAPPAYTVPPQPELYVSQRDPYVFWNPRDKQYWCVMTCRVRGSPQGRDGSVGYATSPDLRSWTPRGHLFYPGTIGEPECPQVFSLAGRWYLLASVYDRAVGRPSYWVADAPTGPWRTVGPRCLDGKDLCAAQAAVDGDRVLLFGWIPLGPSQPGNQHWGGHLALPREVYALEAGRGQAGQLATRLPASLGRLLRGKPADGFSPQAARFLAGDWTATVSELRFAGNAQCGRALLADCGGGAECEVDVALSPSAQAAGVFLQSAAERPAVEIAVQRRPLRLQVVTTGSPSPIAEIPIDAFGAKPKRLRVLVDGDIVEAFLDDRSSLAARVAENLAGARIGLFAQGGPVRFANPRLFQVRPPRRAGL